MRFLFMTGYPTGAILQNKPITIFTKSELYNPEFDHALKNKIKYTIEPKPVILLEEYLALYDQIRRCINRRN